MLATAQQNISHVNSQAHNNISVTHKITVQLEVQPPCSQQRIRSNLRKSGELEKAIALVFLFHTPGVSPFHECRYRCLECDIYSSFFLYLHAVTSWVFLSMPCFEWALDRPASVFCRTSAVCCRSSRAGVSGAWAESLGWSLKPVLCLGRLHELSAIRLPHPFIEWK